MTRDERITKVYIPILRIIASIICAIIGFFAGSTYQAKQTNVTSNEINLSIVNTLNGELGEISTDADLETNTTLLIDAYKDIKYKNESQIQEIDDLQSIYEQKQTENDGLQQENEKLQQENERLQQENEKLKAFLLHNNAYADDINDLVIVEETSDRLENLSVNDSMGYYKVDSIKDFHGDFHSVSYRLQANGTAYVEYKLARKYDLFDANIITTSDTGSDVLFSVEIYLDESYLKRIDNITRDTNLVSLGPIVVTDVDRLKIKVIKMEGPWNNAICYITDDSLKVVQ